MKKIILVLLAICFLQIPAFAQNNSSNMKSVRRGIATVMFTSLAGAVLGLSTLSFYGEPQEHIGNIWLGMGVGAIAGGVMVLSQKSSGYSEMQWPTNPHQRQVQAPMLFAHQWDF